VVRVVALGDDEAAIQEQLDAAYHDGDLVVITGGLGPTHDDVTKVAVAAYFGVALQFDAAVFEQVKARFAHRARAMPESNRSQAMVPEGFSVLPNPVGTAPGLWYAREAKGRTQVLVVLPGVPYEMQTLMRDEVMPRLRSHRDLRVIAHRTLLTTGIGESNLQERIGDLSGLLGRSLRLAYLPSTTGVRLRLTAYGDTRGAVAQQLDRLEVHLRERIDRYIFGTDGDTLEGVVGWMLREHGRTIALAESCTGGFVANRLTNVPGSSAYVLGGVVAYSNGVKIDVLDVSPAVLEEEGAVSERVARQMARGVRRYLKADIGVSTTGIAGPSGGSPDKPVGTVWIGYADAAGDQALLFRFAHDRVLNKELASTAVLELVRRQLLRRNVAPHEEHEAS
jgi:nicotinamide-nucleotide amidase